MYKKIPEINFKETKALVILSTQRSGSTMLCKDIQSIKILGTPEEHFYWVIRNNDEKTGEELLDYFTLNGNKFNSNFYSLKLMYNYLPIFGYWISDRNISLNDSKNRDLLCEYAIKFFLKKFEDVTFIYLKRNCKFEQALSHYKAIKTNVFHIINGKKIYSNYKNITDESCLLNDIDIGLFDQLYDNACNEDRLLQILINKLGIDYLSLVYEEIRNSYPDYLLDIAERAGVKIDISSLGERQTTKIVSDDFVSKFKEVLIKKTNRKYN